MMPLEKVIQFNTKKPPVDVPSDSNNDKIEVDNSQEEINMSQENYSKNEIDLKFENLEQKIDSKFDNLTQKIEFAAKEIVSETKNMLLEQQIQEKSERENERKVTNRWLIGIAITIGIFVIKEFFIKN